MALKLIYLVARSLLSWLRLSRLDSASKDVEILVLRHQLAVAQLRIPARELQRRLSWADRGWLTLLAGLVPKQHLIKLRLIVTPGTLLRSNRDLLRFRGARRSRRGRPGRHRRIGESRRWCFD